MKSNNSISKLSLDFILNSVLQYNNLMGEIAKPEINQNIENSLLPKQESISDRLNIHTNHELHGNISPIIESTDQIIVSKEQQNIIPIQENIIETKQSITTIDRLLVIPKAIYDFIIPLAPMDKPIKGYSQATRAKMRLLRARVGLGIHIGIAIASPFIYTGGYLVGLEAINAFALGAGVIYPFSVDRRGVFKLDRLKRLIPGLKRIHH